MAGQQSTFDTLLGKLSSLIGDDNPEATAYGVKNALFGFPGVSKATNALNPDPQVTNRASMLPIGNYDDGSVGLAWPQSAVDAYEAMGRFGRGENPQPQDAVLAGLAMTGGGFGSLAGRGVRAVSGRALESAEPPVALPSHSVEAGSAPVTARVYRGASNAEQWPPQYPEHNVFWASDDPAAASNYTSEALKWGSSKASVTPADVTFDNPMIVDAAGRRWDSFGTEDTNALARRARSQGHDGLIVRNVIDNLTGSGEPASTYAALQPGTVRSSTTGETLFSNPKEAAPAGMLATANAGERPGIRAYHGSPHDFDRFDSSKIGSGEGAQAYGHGLYFAENEGVARSYRNALGPKKFYQDSISNPDTGKAFAFAQSAVEAHGGDIGKALDYAKRRAASGADDIRAGDYAEAAKLLESWKENPPFKGRMYEVNINSTPDQFLDWDNPISQQSETVRNALSSLPGVADEVRAFRKSRGEDPTGMTLVQTLPGASTRIEATKLLSDVGIHGVRYLDGASRRAGEGTRNYVVFPGNENLIDILRKYSNPPEAAPAGLLATSGLDRMRVEDAAKPRSIPDAPMSLDDLQSYVDQNFENGSGNRVIAARAENPQRYWDYANGLHDVINPESDWISSGPTLQSGGVSGAAVGTAGSSEHHSRSQPRGEGGRFVARDSFDGRLAALDKMMVDLDGDGTPDVAMPANALMRVGQGSAPNYLNKRGYQDQLPPAQSNFEHWTDDMLAEWSALVSKKAAELEKQGLPKSEAMMRAQDEPDMKAARARILQRAPKEISPEMRHLLDQ